MIRLNPANHDCRRQTVSLGDTLHPDNSLKMGNRRGHLMRRKMPQNSPGGSDLRYSDAREIGGDSLAARGKKTFTLIDLFCGAGGFTVGFSATGRFKPVFANDFNSWAVETYNFNFGNHCVGGDINALLRKPNLIPKADVVIGGPPCQGFSLLNKKKEGDPRKQLWRAYMKVVEIVEPTVFVMENVPELLRSEEYQQIAKTARRLGYQLISAILNAADYGVAQRRRRAFIIATRVGEPQLPPPTHISQEARGGLFDGNRLTWRTVRDEISDLPPPKGTEIMVGKVPPPMDLHFGRNPTKESLIRYRCVPEGGNRIDLQKKRRDLTPKCWINKKGGTDLFGRLWWDRPAFTIRTEFFKPEKGRYLHPEQHRPITHREAARLMSFPDDFIFQGTKIEVAKQIGNAVPPRLAERVAAAVIRILDTAAVPTTLASAT